MGHGGSTGTAGALALAARPAAADASVAVVQRITDAPSAPLAAAIVGPGGTGKTSLLDRVARAYERAGVDVLRWAGTGPAPLDRLDPGKAVLVDDAHRLEPSALDGLRRFAEGESARLVLTYRPWPRPTSLSALTAAAADRRVVVVVSHLGRAAVAARIAERVGGPPPEQMVELVHEQSGGLPALVDLVTQALLDAGRFDPGRPDRFRRPDRVTVSVALAERLRHQVDALDAGVHELLEAMAVGATLDGDVLGPLLGRAPHDLTTTVEAARATGLLTDAGELIPFVRSLFLRLTPMLRSRELQRSLAGIELDRGGSVLAAGRQLLGTGAGGSRIATVFVTAAEEAAETAPALAADLLAAAVDAGRPAREVAGRRAHALALAGDLDQALRVADRVVGDPAAPDREAAVATAAAVLAHRGLPGRSVDLYRSLPPHTAVLAVPALVSTGRVDEARAVLDAARCGPTDGHGMREGAASLLARGMLATTDGSAPAALSLLARAAVLLEPVAPVTLLPDTPAALTAVVALQCGELSIAETALRTALEAGHGGRAARPRHRLLHGWVLLGRGRPDAARRALDACADLRLEPRDEFVAAALGVALARRQDDPAAPAAAWLRARDALVRHPVDLCTLAPLGELAVAAAQLGEEGWLAAHLEEADALLDRLGRPALWAAPLAWFRLLAALAAGRPAEIDAHVAALRSAASAGPYAAVLAAAAECWARVVAGDVDVDEVAAVGRRMQAVGLGAEAGRLAGAAAGRAGDRRSAAGLHAFARAVHGAPGAEAPVGSGDVPDAPAAVEPAPAPGPAVDGPALSDREAEIGRFILAGLTYRQIGQRLFISAKTVEHHVARIRRRLGVTSRNELFDRLRVAVEATAPAPPA